MRRSFLGKARWGGGGMCCGCLNGLARREKGVESREGLVWKVDTRREIGWVWGED